MTDAAAVTNVAYTAPDPAATRGNLLDLYLPGRAHEPAPLIIWSRGSAWLRDDGKEGAAEIAPFFTARGYAVAGVSVRSSSQALFPAQLEDGKDAVRWLRAHSDEHGLDPARVAFMGNSSGGWLAAMVALAARDGAERVQAAVDFYGPTDFLQMDAHMPGGGAEFNAFLGVEDGHADPLSPESRLVGGPIEMRRDACARANPITHVRPDAPPMLILHGQDDPFVPHHQSELLFEALRASGAEATFYSIPEVGHAHPYVTSARRAAGYVATTTAGDGAALPPPTWETIEAFVANAFRRAG